MTRQERVQLAKAIDDVLSFLYVPISKSDDEQEQELVDLLIEWWSGNIDDLSEELDNLYGSDEIDVPTDDDIEDIISIAQERMSRLDDETIEKILEMSDRAYGAGKLLIEELKNKRNGEKAGIVDRSFTQVDQSTQKALGEHTIFWVGEYYTEQLGEEIAEAVREYAVDSGLGRKEVGEKLKELLEVDYGNKSKVYWEGLAANTITRARSLGAVEGMVEADVDEYSILAMMDKRTSAICRAMHGKVFKVSKAVELRDALINAKSPEDVKEIAPWVKSKEAEALKEKSGDELPVGLALPPYHFRCRTTLVPNFK